MRHPPSNNAIADEQSDVDLPAVAGPSKVRIQRRRSRKERNQLTTKWTERTKTVEEEKKFEGYTEDGTIKVGVFHDLEVGAEPYDFSPLILPESSWDRNRLSRGLTSTGNEQHPRR